MKIVFYVISCLLLMLNLGFADDHDFRFSLPKGYEPWITEFSKIYTTKEFQEQQVAGVRIPVPIAIMFVKHAKSNADNYLFKDISEKALKSGTLISNNPMENAAYCRINVIITNLEKPCAFHLGENFLYTYQYLFDDKATLWRAEYYVGPDYFTVSMFVTDGYSKDYSKEAIDFFSQISDANNLKSLKLSEDSQ